MPTKTAVNNDLCPACGALAPKRPSGKRPSHKDPAGEVCHGVVPSIPLRKKAVPVKATQPAEKAEAPVYKSLSPDNKSALKATRFVERLKAASWTGTMKSDNKNHSVIVLAKRGEGLDEETLYIRWDSGVCDGSQITYTHRDRTIKLRNAAAALRRIALTPTVVAEEYTRVSSRAVRRSREVLPKQRKLPFNPNEVSDEELVDAIVGRTLTWHNRLRTTPEQATIVPDPTLITIKAPAELGEPEDRIINVCTSDTGFRSFRLSALISVGGRRPYTKRTTTAAPKKSLARKKA